MKKIVTIFILLSIITLSLNGCSSNNEKKDETEPLIVAMELTYPPFETKDNKGKPTGISVDFSKAFAKYINREIIIQNTSFDGLIPSLQTGEADMVMSSMTIRDDRKEIVDFSIPYANAMLAILTNKDSAVKSIEDLNVAGKKVAVKSGSTGFLYAQNHLKNADIITLADESACVVEVAQGKADGFIYDQLTIYRNWQKHQDTTSAIFIPFQDVEKWGVAVQKGNTKLLKQLNTFIKKYTKEGGFDTLTNKYLSEEKKAFDELKFKWFFDLNE
ncbi:MAG: transporter substrate-binding domain-containing protein [Erysipelotrichaceae bacterium]